MSEAEQTPEERRDGPCVLYCPHCGHHGAFDGQGTSTKHFKRVRSSGGESVREQVAQEWSQHHCPECDGTFRVLDEEHTTELEAA